MLGVVDEEEFVERAVAGLGPQPPNFRAIVAINTGPLAGRLTQVDPLTPRQVEQHQRDGALVVDVRTELQFDDAHIPGAICITVLRAGFGSRLAWLADHDQPVVVVGRDDDDARGAIGLAASVGVTNVAGYLAGGMTSWREDQLRVARIPRMTVPELHERWEDGPPVQVLDVRELSEWQSGHIPGAVHTPYHDLHALPDGHRRRRPRGGHLRVGAARRRGRQPAGPPRRPRGRPRGRRRRGRVGAPGLAAGRRPVGRRTSVLPRQDGVRPTFDRSYPPQQHDREDRDHDWMLR